MKNLMLLLLSLVFINCKSDDDAKPQEILENKMTFMGQEIFWKNHCFYYDYEENEVSFNLTGVEYYDGIEFHFSGIEIADLGGTYTFHNDPDSPEYDPHNNFFKALIDYRPEGDEPQEYSITGGTIEVERMGENIKLNYEVTTTAGPAIGSFEGSFIENN